MGGTAYVGVPAGTILLALLVLAIVFIALWSLFAPDDEETRYYTRLAGVKGGKAKKVVEEDDEDVIVDDDLI